MMKDSSRTPGVMTRGVAAIMAPTVKSVIKFPWVERVAFSILILLTLLAVFAPLVTPFDPYARVSEAFQPPSFVHLFGTDSIGRDVLSRVILGIQTTWLPSLLIIAVGVAIGVPVGLLSGAYGGWTDRVLQRLTDLFLVLPATLIAIAIVAALGPGLMNTVIAIAIFWWPWYSRMTRGDIQAITARPHVEAAKLSGAPWHRQLFRYILPGAFPSILVTATLDVANVVLMLATFSFLGLGAPAPTPELGAMTASSLEFLTSAWWLPIFPALVVGLLALSANIAGDSIRSAMKHE